jgi:hypothetical protein
MKTNFLILFLFSVGIISCNKKSNFYTMEDFAKVEKTDAHYHIYSAQNNSMEQAQTDNFNLLTVNVYSGDCAMVKELQKQSAELHKNYKDDYAYAATFCLDDWDDSTWVENTIAWLDSCIAEGAIAVKVWKNIGMEFRDKDSVLIMIDDPKFDPVFKHLAEKGIRLVGHLGEPKNCWLPFNEMTTRNDSSYFTENPQYHMFLHPEFPTYEEQIAARDRMLDKNPDLVFIGCHLASLEWSVDEIGAWLDKYPNTAVDMAARMGQLYYQTRENREKVRDFFIKYQDRILYGTDIIDHGQKKSAFQNRIHETWLRDWEYVVTDHKMTSELINGEFTGLQLPKDVVDKIYEGNAKKWYRIP